MLLCDIGNSYFHFFYKGKMWKEGASNLSKINPQITIYYISVNPLFEQRLLDLHPNSQNIENFIKIDTIYKGLGIDRIAACNVVKDGIIIDAGSAITVDVMYGGMHMGGYILPGFDLYEKMFSGIKILDVGINPRVDLFALPQNTRDAISYGCLQSMILPIKNIVRDDFLYFTGGNGKFLAQFFENAIYDNTLVFQGMLKALKDHGIMESK